jgi:glutaredoxin
MTGSRGYHAMLSCLAVLAALAVLGACEDDGEGEASPDTLEEGELDLRGEPIEPPFAVRGDLEGLLIVWFDEGGPHTATSRDEIPEAHRERVRVDSLRLSPEERDPDHVYVADVRAERDGRYEVRRLPRETFDALVDRAAGTTAAANADTNREGEAAGGGAAQADVIIYGAEWCSACHAAARYLTERGVPFVEKDIERDPGALAEMQQKARRAGINPTGIPVIDVRGTIVTGFDRGRIDAILRGT